MGIYTIERWSEQQPRWLELLKAITEEGQTNWFTFSAPFHSSNHVLVALQENEVIGFLRFVVQAIGSDVDAPPVRLKSAVLTEAKILAFGVRQAHRRQGIGRTLQAAALEWAKELGCYQVRSKSDNVHAANHALKLTMGFGVHPVNEPDWQCVFFIMPLARVEAKEKIEN